MERHHPEWHHHDHDDVVRSDEHALLPRQRQVGVFRVNIRQY
jgi:hypothetical protein